MLWFVPLYVFVIVYRLFSGYGYAIDELSLEMNILIKEEDEIIVIDDYLRVSKESYKGWKYLLLLEDLAVAFIMFIFVLAGTIYAGMKWLMLFILLGCAGFVIVVAFLGIYRSEADSILNRYMN